MPNIMINNSCNLRCEYCFADDCKIISKEMDEDSFLKALDFCKSVGYVGIIGGEPTLHAKCKDFINIVQSDCEISNACLFTNGVFLDRVIENLICENNKFNILVNLNHPSVGGTSQKAYEMSLENIEKLIDNDFNGKLSVGINIFKKDQEVDYILEVIQKFNISRLRVSVAAPNTKEKREKDKFEYYNEIKETVISLAEKCSEIGCEFGIDCSFLPPCVYTEDEKARLLKASVLLEMKGIEGFREKIETQICSPVIDILPDLKLVRCFGTSCMEEIDIDMFEDIFESEKYFTHRIDGKLYYEREYKCGSCKKHLLGECNGGCLGFQAK